MSDLLSFKDALILQADSLLGVTLACASSLMTILAALVVYSNRLSFLWTPRSMVISFGLSTGGILCFTFVELLPAAHDAFQRIIKDWFQDDSVSLHMQDAYASLILSGTFAIGVMMAWVVDTLCLYCAIPKRSRQNSRTNTLYESCTSQPRLTHQQPPALASPQNPCSQDQWLTKEHLYKTGTAKVISFSVQNIPVGMVLCLTTSQRKSFGILFACAILLHNVTQGTTMAGLITQASGLRWRAVLWCVLSALALPIGAFLSWGILLQTSLEPIVYGVFYAVVSGLLLGMSLTQILMVCYNYKTPSTHRVTLSIVGGVVLMESVLMALSFLYSEEYY